MRKTTFILLARLIVILFYRNWKQSVPVRRIKFLFAEIRLCLASQLTRLVGGGCALVILLKINAFKYYTQKLF